MSNAKPNRLDTQLLTDLQRYFARQPATHYPTEQLLNYLAAIDNAPWATLAQGKAITARHLARLLQPYGIAPKTIRFADGLAKGYRAADFNSVVTDKVADIVDVTDRIESAKVDVTDRKPVLADSDVTDSVVTDKVADIVDVTDRKRVVTATIADNVADNPDDVAAPVPAQPVRKWPPPKGWTWNHQTAGYEPPTPTVEAPIDQELIRQTLRVSSSLKYLPGYGLTAV